MREYGASWKGNSKDKTGLVSLACGNKEILFKMDNFETFLTLCEFIDNVATKVESRNQTAIFEYINSYRKAY